MYRVSGTTQWFPLFLYCRSPPEQTTDVTGNPITTLFGSVGRSAHRYSLGSSCVLGHAVVATGRVCYTKRGMWLRFCVAFAVFDSRLAIHFPDRQAKPPNNDIATERIDAMEPIIKLHQVTYQPPTAVHPIVTALSIDLHPAEVLVLLGPSGSGKTTTLRLIAGLELPDSGLITIRGVPAGRTMPPEARRVGMVFQDYALFPHMTVLENVRFALHATPKPQQLGQAMHAIAQVGLAGLEQRMPHQLSGGQQQRVAIARALAPQPSVILLDEPFSNLDTAIRDRVRTELRTILRAANTAAIIVTHDQTEALAIADRVALLHDGILHQIGTPEALYGAPRTRFAAQFMGPADFVVVDAQFHTSMGPVTPVGTIPANANLTALVRYDDVTVTVDTTNPNAEVIERLFEGPSYLYSCRLDDGAHVHCRTPHETKIPIGQRIALSYAATHPMVCFADEVACGHVTAMDTGRRS